MGIDKVEVDEMGSKQSGTIPMEPVSCLGLNNP